MDIKDEVEYAYYSLEDVSKTLGWISIVLCIVAIYILGNVFYNDLPLWGKITSLVSGGGIMIMAIKLGLCQDAVGGVQTRLNDISRSIK